MSVKIVTLEAQKAVGLVYRGQNENGEIPRLWDVFNGRYKELKPSSPVCYGLCYMDSEDNSFAYMAGVSVSDLETVPEGMEVTSIPAGHYAVFTFTEHISKIKEFWDEIYTRYLPENSLVPLNQMSFELYDERFQQNGECDIYIPVVK